jgi:hypothetical protein
MIMVVNQVTAFVNVPLGITLCSSCCTLLGDLKGDYAYSFAYLFLNSSNVPLTTALVFLDVNSSTWNNQAIKEIRESLNFINLHGMLL